MLLGIRSNRRNAVNPTPFVSEFSQKNAIISSHGRPVLTTTRITIGIEEYGINFVDDRYFGRDNILNHTNTQYNTLTETFINNYKMFGLFLK